MELVHSREQKSSILSRLTQDPPLHEVLQEHLGVFILWYVAYAPVIQTHLGMMTALMERWHNETCSFHLPIGEATVTLEDMWHILCFPIHKERVIYDVDAERDVFYDIMGLNELVFSEGQIELERYRIVVPSFRLIVVAIISGLVALDRCGRYFSLGWGLAWEQML